MKRFFSDIVNRKLINRKSNNSRLIKESIYMYIFSIFIFRRNNVQYCVSALRAFIYVLWNIFLFFFFFLVKAITFPLLFQVKAMSFPFLFSMGKELLISFSDPGEGKFFSFPLLFLVKANSFTFFSWWKQFIFISFPFLMK